VVGLSQQSVSVTRLLADADESHFRSDRILDNYHLLPRGCVGVMVKIRIKNRVRILL